MRVLHLYAGNLFGGIERLLVTLARERTVCPEMEPEFGLCFEGRLADELRVAGVKVHMLGEVRFSQPWTVWRARRALKLELRQKHFDVVICHSCWPHAIFGPTVRAAGVPIVFWCIMFLRECIGPKGWRLEYLLRWCWQTATSLRLQCLSYFPMCMRKSFTARFRHLM